MGLTFAAVFCKLETRTVLIMADPFDWNGDGKPDSFEETNKVITAYHLTHDESDHTAPRRPAKTPGKGGLIGFAVFFGIMAIIAFYAGAWGLGVFCAVCAVCAAIGSTAK